MATSPGLLGLPCSAWNFCPTSDFEWDWLRPCVLGLPCLGQIFWSMSRDWVVEGSFRLSAILASKTASATQSWVRWGVLVSCNPRRPPHTLGESLALAESWGKYSPVFVAAPTKSRTVILLRWGREDRSWFRCHRCLLFLPRFHRFSRINVSPFFCIALGQFQETWNRFVFYIFFIFEIKHFILR